MATPLSSIMADAKDLADLLNNTLVGDPTWRRWANQGKERLYRMLVVKAPARFQKSVFFTLTGGVGLGADTVQLATDFRELREGGVTKDPLVQGTRRTLHRFNFAERDAQGQLPPWGSERQLGYDIQGQASAANLVIEPASICAGSYAYFYLAGPAPWLTDGTQDGTNIEAVLEPYVDFVAHTMAIKALQKEESLDSAQALKQDLAGLIDEIQAEFSEGSDPATIIDVDQTGGGRFWR